MLFLVSIHLFISNHQDKTLGDDQYVFYSTTEIKDFKPYKPKVNGNFNKQLNFPETDHISYGHELSIIYPYSTNNTVTTTNNWYINNLLQNGYTTQKKNTQFTEGTTGGDLAFILRGKSSASETEHTAPSSQVAANIENIGLFSSKPLGFESQFGLNDNTEYGLPDPGGDPTFFIPVPDGFKIMMFFVTLYLLWKLIQLHLLPSRIIKRNN